MINKLKIRTVELSDIDKIVKLNHALFQEDARQRDPFMNLNWPLEYGRAYFSKLLSNPASICFFAEVNGDVAGYLIGYVKNKRNLRPVLIAELESMFVEEEFRGQGMGTALANRFLKWSQEQGAQRITVTAYAANKLAIAFYERLGFEPKSLSLELGIA